MDLKNKFKIWGVEIEEIMFDGKIWWKIYLRNPFWKDGWKFGINEKIFRNAWERGVDKFIVQVGGKEVMMEVFGPKDLKEKEKSGEYEDKPSMFQNSPPLRIYHFNL